MDWKAIMERSITVDVDAIKEYHRQHLQEHHGPHRHRFGDGVWVTGSELPMEDKPEQPQFKLNLENADIGKPKVCECEPKIKGRSLVKNNWTDTDEWVYWKFCPKCGLKLKEEK